MLIALVSSLIVNLDSEYSFNLSEVNIEFSY